MGYEAQGDAKPFHGRLLALAKSFSHGTYRLTEKFPKREQFSASDQLRRAALSVSLNLVEGYARGPGGSYRQFLLISYGSLKESEFLIQFALDEGWVLADDTPKLLQDSNELGAMLYSTIQRLRNADK